MSLSATKFMSRNKKDRDVKWSRDGCSVCSIIRSWIKRTRLYMSWDTNPWNLSCVLCFLGALGGIDSKGFESFTPQLYWVVKKCVIS